MSEDIVEQLSRWAQEFDLDDGPTETAIRLRAAAAEITRLRAFAVHLQEEHEACRLDYAKTERELRERVEELEETRKLTIQDPFSPDPFSPEDPI